VSASTPGLGGLLFLGLFVGPFYLMGCVLVGLVKLGAWVLRTAAGNRVAAPTRHP
jgi:hypothetical protein